MPKVLIDGQYVDVSADALFADDGQTPLSFAQQAVQGRFFTEEDVARIRAEEKDKVYGRLESVQQELAAFKETVGSLTAAEQRREAQLKEEEARLAEEARRKEEEELDAKTLLQRKDEEWKQTLAQQQEEWNSRFEQSEQERQNALALAAKEREFNDLKDYALAQIDANEDRIAPQLRNLVGGNSKEEIDASIARVIEATDGILAEVQQALPQQQMLFEQQPQVPSQQQFVAPPPPTPGTRVTATPGQDPGAQFQTLTKEDIDNMSMDQYAKLRGTLGIGGQGQNRGLFG